MFQTSVETFQTFSHFQIIILFRICVPLTLRMCWKVSISGTNEVFQRPDATILKFISEYYDILRSPCNGQNTLLLGH